MSAVRRAVKKHCRQAPRPAVHAPLPATAPPELNAAAGEAAQPAAPPAPCSTAAPDNEGPGPAALKTAQRELAQAMAALQASTAADPCSAELQQHFACISRLLRSTEALTEGCIRVTLQRMKEGRAYPGEITQVAKTLHMLARCTTELGRYLRIAQRMTGEKSAVRRNGSAEPCSAS
jgi:hypothetical protein